MRPLWTTHFRNRLTGLAVCDTRNRELVQARNPRDPREGKKGKFLGTEFELDELQVKTVAAEARVEPEGTPYPPPRAAPLI